MIGDPDATMVPPLPADVLQLGRGGGRAADFSGTPGGRGRRDSGGANCESRGERDSNGGFEHHVSSPAMGAL